jgi:hypothetical protein
VLLRTRWLSQKQNSAELNMATKGDKKHTGVGSHGKGDGSGAMTDMPPERIPDNMVLSNRDKAQHSKQRGLDSKNVQTEQERDHESNRVPEESEGDKDLTGRD